MLMLEKMIVLLIVIEVLYQVFPEALRATRMLVLLPVRMVFALYRVLRAHARNKRHEHYVLRSVRS